MADEIDEVQPPEQAAQRRRERPLRRIGSHRPQLTEDYRAPPVAPPLPPPARRAPEEQQEAANAVDDLDYIIRDDRQFPMALRVLAQRLQTVEAGLPSTVQVGQSLIQLDTRLRQLEPQVEYLSRQRAVAEMSMERQARIASLDLAIKAVPEAQRAEEGAAGMITVLAEAFLRWIRSGENH